MTWKDVGASGAQVGRIHRVVCLGGIVAWRLKKGGSDGRFSDMVNKWVISLSATLSYLISFSTNLLRCRMTCSTLCGTCYIHKRNYIDLSYNLNLEPRSFATAIYACYYLSF